MALNRRKSPLIKFSSGKDLKLYIFEISGVWVPGYAFAIAESLEDANNQLEAALPDYLKGKVRRAEPKAEYGLDDPIAAVIYDGEM